jgi:hypothetical protein
MIQTSSAPLRAPSLASALFESAPANKGRQSKAKQKQAAKKAPPWDHSGAAREGKAA